MESESILGKMHHISHLFISRICLNDSSQSQSEWSQQKVVLGEPHGNDSM